MAGPKLSVTLGDITTQDVDALVNETVKIGQQVVLPRLPKCQPIECQAAFEPT
jgi:hypothetical protein